MHERDHELFSTLQAIIINFKCRQRLLEELPKKGYPYIFILLEENIFKCL